MTPDSADVLLIFMGLGLQGLHAVCKYHRGSEMKVTVPGVLRLHRKFTASLGHGTVVLSSSVFVTVSLLPHTQWDGILGCGSEYYF